MYLKFSTAQCASVHTTSSPALRATLASCPELFRTRGEGMRNAGGEGEKKKVIKLFEKAGFYLYIHKDSSTHTHIRTHTCTHTYIEARGSVEKLHHVANTRLGRLRKVLLELLNNVQHNCLP